VVEKISLKQQQKTWKLDRLTRALTALSPDVPAKASKTLSVYEPSFLLAGLSYTYTGKMMILDTSQAPHWQKLVYWTAFCNTLFYLLTRDSTTVRLQHRFALALGCYSYVYALSDEARKQQCVSFASIIISTIAVGHMVWLYRQRRGTR
jgi:hypothetical protein